MMRTLVLALVACALPLAVAAESAPGFEAVSLEGDSLALEDFRGRVVLVEFWASWCPPCREQLPRAAALEQELDDLVVLAVSVDTRRDRVERFAKRVRLPSRVVLDPQGRIADLFEVQAMPWSVLVDEDGTVLWQGSRIGEVRATLDDALRRVRASD